MVSATLIWLSYSGGIRRYQQDLFVSNLSFASFIPCVFEGRCSPAIVRPPSHGAPAKARSFAGVFVCPPRIVSSAAVGHPALETGNPDPENRPRIALMGTDKM
jgi:hypothetical protein